MTSPITPLEQYDTIRLIPSKYSEGGDSVLARIADGNAHLETLFELDHATNDRLKAERDVLPGIAAAELVFNQLHYRIINAAFCHASPTGARFSGPDRGAWYSGFTAQTSLAEVIFHKTVALAEINYFKDSVTYDAYSADFKSDFHDIRGLKRYENCLQTSDYRPAQLLAESLLAEGSNGVIYPSVRDQGGTCLACFKPSLVMNVKRKDRWRFTWDGDPTPTVKIESA